MTSSRVEISFHLSPRTIKARAALNAPNPPFTDLTSGLAARLKGPTLAAVEWSDQFKSAAAAGYIQAICDHATSIRPLIVDDISSYLNTFHSATGCSLDICELSPNACYKCGPGCHKVVGGMMISCSGLASTPLVLTADRGDATLEYELEVLYTFTFSDCNCDEPGLVMATNSRRSSEDLAAEMHAYYVELGVFPPFWRSFGSDLRRLQRIFDFFAKMDLERVAAPRELVDLLTARLGDRHNARAPRSGAALRSVVAAVVGRVLPHIRALDTLAGAAFDNFASGSFAMPYVDPVTRFETTTTALRLPEPNGYMLFCWAEFAFLAIELGIEEVEWKRFLPVALRAQRIYAMTYGDPNGEGRPPAYWSSKRYHPSTHRPLLPSAVASYAFAHLTDIKDLEKETNDCVAFAFPGGMD